MSPYRREPDSWPWPADNLTERAQRVARSYRDMLLVQSPDLCAGLDARMAELGQHWLLPQVDQFEHEELLTPRQAATFCQVAPTTLPKWCSRGLVATPTPDGSRYKVRDLLDYQAKQRLRRLRGKRATDPC